jgi:hypothetical protein
MKEENKNKYCKYYNRDNWVISNDKDKYYEDIRQSLKEIGCLMPAKSKHNFD